MSDNIKNVVSNVWDDVLKGCKLFTSVCGFTCATISLVNAVKPQTLCPLSFTDKPKSAGTN